MQSKAKIYPTTNGKIIFETGRAIYVCSDADEVGEQLEPMLWPLIERPLKENKPFTITIEYDSDEL